MSKPLLAKKLSNAFKKAGLYQTHLKNIIVNGDKRGCSGFIVNPANGNIVYLNTEHSVYGPLSDKCMYRTAPSIHEYSKDHGINHFCEDGLLVKNVVALLEAANPV